MFHCYLILINVLTLIFMTVDKRNARTKRPRIPERILFLLALTGGAPGILMAMFCLRHKTKKARFCIGVPVILSLQIILYILGRKSI